MFELKGLPESVRESESVFFRENTLNAPSSLECSLSKGNNVKFVGEVNKIYIIKLPRCSVSGKQSTHLTFYMGVVTWSFIQIKYISIVWWQKYLSCISDIPRSAEKANLAAAW